MEKIFFLLILFFTFACVSTSPESGLVEKVSIEALQNETFNAEFKLEKELLTTDSYKSSLVSYSSDGLKVFALINKPVTVAPEKGYPVLIFGHGFHPTPKEYGVSSSTGKDWRPGDYYRGIPETFARNGYLVVTPDYRGHNASEGFDFTKKSFLASSFYARDVLSLISGLNSLPDADMDNIFFMGHSMGGDVGLKVLLANDQINAASLWAPMVSSTYQQALYYGKYYDQENDKVDVDVMQSYLDKIEEIYTSLPMPVKYADVDPIEHINELSTPVIIHHARNETAVPYIWSESLVAKLHQLNKEYELYTYDSANHLFKDENLKLAFERDLAFFKKYQAQY
ncbi:MAG: prolyl oligopeptidase family serine peptidase [Gammaproteobacteria bacterium]|nr:prolyl oligopeptidase family serine peptidase [Gammaproteobacteria bacterium]NNM14175.1 prolyl oligopeptidase family serine peptidase [Gammaproteobacteria bacterium]